MLFTLQVRDGSLADHDFRPTPIPLNEWHEGRDSRSYEEAEGAQQESAEAFASLSTDAVTPAHYWEEALRHSVYLTLVRDKIDELIAKGANHSQPYNASEDDDHDLWEKIKTAPFNRIENEDFVTQGDVTIMAKGRLMQENDRFHFMEDDLDKEKCKDDKCQKDIKAIWSVKRVRQREVESSPGKFHYELTFSVVSQLPKEKRKPHANTVRTFTVRESTPERVVEMPQEKRKLVHTKHRPQRVVWFHRNISPPFPAPNEGRQHKNGLERLFSSLFSDDDDDDYLPPRHRKVIPYHPPYGPHGSAHGLSPHSPYSKIGYVGSPSDQQKRLTYPYKQSTYKYSRPIPPPPYAYGPKPHYLETESVGASFSNPHLTPPEHVHSPLGKPILTTKPAVLPTLVSSSNKTHEKDKSTQEATESVTRVPEIVTGKPISRPRIGPIKINYLPDHVRPPVYNAPPGIFVTMDKKPFKPMPPLKLKVKPYKISRPTDFRPSPQVLDMQQFSEPDPFKETAFRPITWNYQDTTTNTASTTENTEDAERNTTASTTIVTQTQKNYTKGKKPPKKHENIKSQLTTSTPDIITGNASFEEEDEPDIGWANLINAFSKTTPMASQKEKTEATESSTSDSSSTTETTTIARRRTSTTTEAEELEDETWSTTTSTTVKPRKRTRPPPNFTKPNKVKKHKRITTTTTTQSPEKDKTTVDLTPQASSAAATKPARSTTERTTTMITTTAPKSTSPTYSTTKTTTKPTSTETPATTAKIDVSSSTTQPKIKNRFRQSTLLQKGTSVNHDKWSSLGISTKAPSTLPSIFPPRRKGSNFQSHVTPTIKLNDRKHNLLHEDKNIPLSVQPLSTAKTHYGEHVSDSMSLEYKKEKSDEDDEDDDVEDAGDISDDEDQNNEGEDAEQKEFIFSQTSASTLSDESSDNNEIDEGDSYTTEHITTTQATHKNLTKCQKKKLLNSSTTDQSTVVLPNVYESDNSTDTKTVLEDNNFRSGSTSGILEEIIQSFTSDDAPSAKNPRLADFDQQESQSHFVKLDDDLQDFLDSLDKDQKHVNDDDDYDDDDVDSSLNGDKDGDDGSPIDKWEHKGPRQRHADADADDDYRDRPYGLLELLAME